MFKAIWIFTFVFFIRFSYADDLIIAISANAQYPLRDIIALFKKRYPDLDIKSVVSSSGKLTNQILKGAPYDIFLSADMKYPMFLHRKGLAINKPKIYAYGLLVLWTIKDFPLSLEKLKFANKIAIANPKNAPYGRESIKVLKKAGVYRYVKNRIIYGESISQVNFYIVKGLVDVGFTSKSSVFSEDMKDLGKWIDIDPALYSPIPQGVVILKNATNNRFAKEFFYFLFSKKAKEIFKKYGYLVEK